jgi:hypothetical protein
MTTARDDIRAWFRSNRPLPRPLYPEKLLVDDCLAAMKWMAKFLQRYGYWGENGELAVLMLADLDHLRRILNVLQDLGLVVRVPDRAKTGHSWCELTPAGWSAVGYKPIAPWMKRPKRPITRRVLGG